MKIRSLQELVDRANQMGGTLGAAAMALQVEQDRDDPIQMREKMRQALEVMRQSVESGMDPHTHSVSGLTGGQAARLMAVAESGASVGGTDLTRAAARALAVAEFNAAMGRIVAAPTAGACGILPGTLLSAAEKFGYSDDQLVDARILRRPGRGGGHRPSGQHFRRGGGLSGGMRFRRRHGRRGAGAVEGGFPRSLRQGDGLCADESAGAGMRPGAGPGGNSLRLSQRHRCGRGVYFRRSGAGRRPFAPDSRRGHRYHGPGGAFSPGIPSGNRQRRLCRLHHL